MSSAFSLFPEEVWELILDRITHSKDAWNLFRAIPELAMNAGLEKKKHLWLFGMVLPHLIPSIKVNWIKVADLLNCRLVSRRWSRYVDIFLQTQNQLRAYHCFHPEPQVPGGFYWDTQHYYLERIAGGASGGTMLLLRATQIIGGTHIWDMDDYNGRNLKITRFIEEFEGHLHRRNPFLGRFLATYVFPDGISWFEGCWNNKDVFKLLAIFGMHIWHFQIGFEGIDLEPQYMARCLRLLSNLRTLHLKGSVRRPQEPPGEEELAPFLMPGKGCLPHLPDLETLRIEYRLTWRSGTFLIRRYSRQIRRLDIPIFSCWKDEYSSIFPNLTELELTYMDSWDNEEVKDILLSLEAPLLSKLVLKSNFYRPDTKDFCSCTLSIEVDIFPWLKRFPNMQYLNIGDEYWVARCVEEGTLSPEEDCIPSLKFLSIRISPSMSYNFLRCLPSLQYLHLHVHPEPIVIDHSGQLPPPHVRIRDEIQTVQMYRSNVWELLPKLRTVTLLPENYCEGIYYTFSREGYEMELKQRNGPSSPNSSAGDFGDPFPLRPDIIQFLHKRKRVDRESNQELYFGWDTHNDSDSDRSSN